MYIDDPDSKKPDDWEEEEMIVDKDATKPEDWDENKEGKWNPPKTKNPKYKGPWSAKKVYNPNFKGLWHPKKVLNPVFQEIAMPNYVIGGIGIDVWQVRSGSIFDNIMITDSLEEAFSHARSVLEKQVSREKEFKAVADKEEEFKAAQMKEKLQDQMKETKEPLTEKEDL